MPTITERLAQDVRFKESIISCINCGVCTAICAAAEFYDYSPRQIAGIVQEGNEEKIIALLKSDTIWFCGQCMSCKTRCPRNNCVGIIIAVLRKISQEEGYFVESRMGRQQLLIKRNIGSTILKYGYCIHPEIVNPEYHPEQGPTWEWVYKNKEKVYERMNANLDKPGSGTLRKIEQDTLQELRDIFEVSGGVELFDKIEKYSFEKAAEMGLASNPDSMDNYVKYISNE